MGLASSRPHESLPISSEQQVINLIRNTQRTADWPLSPSAICLTFNQDNITLPTFLDLWNFHSPSVEFTLQSAPTLQPFRNALPHMPLPGLIILTPGRPCNSFVRMPSSNLISPTPSLEAPYGNAGSSVAFQSVTLTNQPATFTEDSEGAPTAEDYDWGEFLPSYMPESDSELFEDELFYYSNFYHTYQLSFFDDPLSRQLAALNLPFSHRVQVLDAFSCIPNLLGNGVHVFYPRNTLHFGLDDLFEILEPHYVLSSTLSFPDYIFQDAVAASAACRLFHLFQLDTALLYHAFTAWSSHAPLTNLSLLDSICALDGFQTTVLQFLYSPPSPVIHFLAYTADNHPGSNEELFFFPLFSRSDQFSTSRT
jgi:hypothetical protein